MVRTYVNDLLSDHVHKQPYEFLQMLRVICCERKINEVVKYRAYSKNINHKSVQINLQHMTMN